MKALIAIDSFKGSATSRMVNQAVAAGMEKLDPTIEVEIVSVADGGEGTLAAFHENGLGELLEAPAADLYNQPITANYVLLDQETAVVEVAEAAGIHFLTEERGACEASSFGFGQLLKTIVDQQPAVQHFIVGLGGSGINDAGIGMLQALGVSLKKADGTEIVPGLAEIAQIATIDASQLNQQVANKKFTLLTDVENPFAGKTGATYTFGRQKGVKDIAAVDAALQHYNQKLTELTGVDYAQQAGTGAAGGIGLSFLSFFQATYVSGASYMIELLGLQEKMQQVDVVITGEGKMDRQSAYGKLPTVIAQKAKLSKKKVIALVGDASEVSEENYQAGIDLVLSLPRGPLSLADSISRTEELAKLAGSDILRILSI